MNGVSDRGADADHVVGVEASGSDIGIVLDVVNVSLGADEEVVPEVIAEAPGDVFHKVVCAGVVDAAGEIAARDYSRKVEPGAGNANANHEVKAKFLIQLWLEERVYVRQDGPVGFITVVAGPVIAPGGLDVNAKAALLVDDIAADAGISSALFRQLRKRLRAIAGVGLHHGAAADRNIALLGRRKMGEEQKAEHVCEKR